MSVKVNRRLLRSSAALIEETSSSLVATPSSKRAKKIRRTEDLIYFSPDLPLKSSNNNTQITVESRSVKQKPQKTPKRKIVKAKRLLRNGITKKAEEDALNEETTACLKEKRKNLKKQENVDFQTLDLTKEDDDEDVKLAEETVANKVAKIMTQSKDGVEEHETENANTTFTLDEKECEEQKEETKDTTFEEKISDKRKEKKSGSTFDLTITTLKNPISPSTSSEELETANIASEDDKTSFEHLHFNSSPENLQPSTSGCVEESAPRRRTFELNNSVTDISLLKVLSMSDSLRMNSFPNEEEQSSISPVAESPSKPFSKVTLRKRWAKNDSADRISKISPPWIAIEEIESISTPLKTPQPIKKANSMLKSVLNKESVKCSTGKKFVSSVKMPNFAAIHQKNFEKMENLSEYKKRKEERAKMLLSGRKPIDDKSKAKTPKKDSRKQLRFATNTSEKKHSLTHIPLPSTPAPKQFMNKTVDDSPVIKMPMFNFTKGKENPFTLFKQTSATKIIKTDNNAISGNSKVPIRVLGLKNALDQRRPFHFGNNELNGKNVIHKKEEIKTMVATKSKPLKRSLEKRRDIIKGVRSNRRFELLMNMRKGK